MGRNGHLKCCVNNILRHGCVWLLVCLIAGTVVAYQLSPVIYRLNGYEVNRIYYIHKYLHDAAKKRPEIVVLGNSVVMNGIDCRRLSEGLAGSPVAWNLGTTGQYVVESMLIFEELPRTVDTVVLGVNVNTLINPHQALSLSRTLPYKVYGYNISKDIIRVLDGIGLEEDVQNLTTPYWLDVLETRSSILNSVNSFMRRRLRKDLALDKSLKDFFYPSPFVKHVSSDTISLMADRLYEPRTADMGRINPVNKKLYNAFGEMAKKHGCRFVFVIMTEHPVHKKRDEPAFYQNLNKSIEQFAAESKFEVYDFKDLLTQDQFVDHIHPDGQGAKILTDAILEKLASGRR